jgi:TPR repeat protein
MMLVGCYAVPLPAQQIEEDRKLLVAVIRAKAQKGDALAQYYLGSCYFKGHGVAANYVEAVKWFRRAAEQNDAKAQCILGACYATGHGVATNYVEAVKWYLQAAEQNLPEAQYNLGFCYAKGQGVAKDEVEAVSWYRQAAERNLADAQCNLGVCYAKGQGVATNHVEAVRWYRQAAEQNDAQAQFNLGFCYAKGRGVAKDVVEAVKWYRKAAEGGDVNAFKVLARILATSENAAIRDGPNAVVFAEKAVAATNRKDPRSLDTLAAAYAEASQFEKAVSTEQEAIALLRTEAGKNDYGTRLKLYETRVPYRVKD